MIDKLDKDSDVADFMRVSYYETENGYIVWRLGTGRNVELLHICVAVRRIGTGRYLLRTMLELIDPCDTIFGFTAAQNEDALKFYAAMGFDLAPVRRMYQDMDALVFSQKYAVLKKALEGAERKSK